MPLDAHFFRTELQRLLQRLARLVQEIGDCHRAVGNPGAPVAPAPTAYLRPTYLHLLHQAMALARGLGFDETEAPAYVTTQLVAQLRASRRAAHQAMSLREARGW